MIIRVTFTDGLTMMVGTSYKKWTTQFDEFCWTNKNTLPDIANVKASNSSWIGWGGLKWCREDQFIEKLKREGCQDNEPDNPNPRKYSEMSFYYNPKFEKIAVRILQDCKNDQTDPELVFNGKLPIEKTEVSQ